MVANHNIKDKEYHIEFENQMDFEITNGDLKIDINSKKIIKQ